MTLLAVATPMQHVAWALLATLGTSAVLVCLVVLAISVFRRSTTRYALSLAGLLLIATTPLAALGAMYAGWIPRAAIWRASNTEPWNTILTVVFWTWAIGLATLSIFHLIGWLRIRAIVTASQPCPAGLRATIARELDLPDDAIRLVETASITTPVAVGARRPVILLPAALAESSTDSALRHLIAHEFGHVVRRDFAVNCVQVTIESLLWLCPAVWLISRQIRIERECCCDEFALRICREQPARYARTLLSLDEHRRRELRLAPASTGGDLAVRVFRLLGARHRAGLLRRLPEPAIVICSGILSAAALLPLFHAPAPIHAQAASEVCVAVIPPISEPISAQACK